MIQRTRHNTQNTKILLLLLVSTNASGSPEYVCKYKNVYFVFILFHLSVQVSWVSWWEEGPPLRSQPTHHIEIEETQRRGYDNTSDSLLFPPFRLEVVFIGLSLFRAQAMSPNCIGAGRRRTTARLCLLMFT